MALHFTPEEFARREAATLSSMAEQGLDGLLIFAQESMFWLTGYDTFGFCFFQCLVLRADGGMTLLTRAPDRLQAKHTSRVEDIRIWVDREDAGPADELADLLRGLGLSGKRLGIEYDTYGLTAKNGMAVNAALDGMVSLVDASELIRSLRVVKSAEEIAYVRRAASAADDALDAAHRTIAPGAFEGDILAAMQGAVFEGGGDYPGNEFIIGSGPDAMLCRYFTGRRVLSKRDQITLEFAGAYRHYHACMMRTIPVGGVPDRQREMHRVAVAAIEECKEALRPGRPVGEVFDAYARVMDRGGFRDARFNACGYSLGATFAPIWMDKPMFFHGNPVITEPGMVFFLHMILMDEASGLAMCPGETVLVTDHGNERLSRSSLDLVVR